MGYVTLQQARAEGVTTAQADDGRLQTLIDLWSAFVDRTCNQWFNPRTMTYRLDGPGTPTIFFDVPIISVTSVTVDDELIDPVDYVVYNRHLGGMLSPDDRASPRVEYQGASEWERIYPARRWRPVWVRGTQNIVVVGQFGYTDPDGSSTGATPLLIQRVVTQLVVRGLPKLADTDSIIAAAQALRVTDERTRDQSVTYNQNPLEKLLGNGISPWTENPEINIILDMYRAPPIVRTTSGGWHGGW